MDGNVASGGGKKLKNVQQKLYKGNTETQQCVTQGSTKSFLSDRNEFPSLSEVSEKKRPVSKTINTCSNVPFSYSDKLKFGQQQKVHNSVFQFKCEKSQSSSNNQISGERPQSTPKNQIIKERSLSMSNTQQFVETKTLLNKRREIGDSRVVTLNSNARNNIGFHSSHENANSKNMHSKILQNQRYNQQSNKDANFSKSTIPNNNIYNEAYGSNSKQDNYSTAKIKKTTNKKDDISKSPNETTEPVPKKKIKKRKSKVKRQVALQSGKITVLTPEAHSKILHQSSSLNSRPSKSVVTDINDSEEYPELGKVLLSKSNKESNVKTAANCLKTEESDITKQKDQVSETPSNTSPSKALTYPVTEELMEESVVQKNSKGESVETVDTSKTDVKTSVRPNEAIVVSFFDIILTSKSKTKEAKVESVKPIIPAKIRSKKGIAHPHNLLDSSPAVKRGKERENPKTKRPTHLKKIILLDRKARKEQNVKLCLNHQTEPKQNDNVYPTSENCQDNLLESNFISSGNEDTVASLNDRNTSNLHGEFQIASKEGNDHPCPLTDNSNTQESIVDDTKESSISPERSPTPIISSIKYLFETEHSDLEREDAKSELHLCHKYNLDNNNDICGTEIFEHENTIDCERIEFHCNNTIHQNNKISKNYEESLLEGFRSFNCCEDFTIKNENKTIIKSAFSDNEKLQAAKIAIHTRNFREYCTHLISKDLDTVVLALLDDLARFQDRMHQKDPVKARMKRRLVYGIKEVKKNVKLRKLKCIIIATDVENVQTEGGLNDALNDIKSSASDHHIPCIFALSKKRLGRVCHKPVGVSCVGIFNYEGSEVNFKKMIEFHNQGTKDYSEILESLISKLSDNDIGELLKARMEAPETLHEKRAKIFSEFVSPVRNHESECQNSEVETENL